MGSNVDHAILVECGHGLESLELMHLMQAVAEGVTEANVAYFTMHPDRVDGGMPRYEDPRPGKFRFNGAEKWVADQVVATAEVIDARKRATCIEWCCWCAGLFRYRDGLDAKCILIPVWGAQKRPIPFRYHAVVALPNGEFYDATAELPGYGFGDMPWYEAAGHCCQGCALGATNYEHEPCEACALGESH